MRYLPGFDDPSAPRDYKKPNLAEMKQMRKRAAAQKMMEKELMAQYGIKRGAKSGGGKNLISAEMAAMDAVLSGAVAEEEAPRGVLKKGFTGDIEVRTPCR